MEIIPLGDSALLVRLSENFSRDPIAALAAVTQAQRRLEAARIPGVVEYAPAYDSIAVFFDPLLSCQAGAPPEKISEWLEGKIGLAFKQRIREPGKSAALSALEIPVCYEGEHAPDLSDVSRQSGLSAREVVRRQSSVEYRVHCVGFVPGFPYLGGLPHELATPRRVSPRKRVAPGSVAIGGAQAGIYPVACPGGWNLIGRTPLRLFDAGRQPPALLKAGDRVRFHPISKAEFESWPR